MKLRKKLASRRGESLTEALVGILIVALSSVVLAAMVTAASHMNAAAIARDKALYDAVTNAESGTPAGTQEVTVTVTVGEETHTFDAGLCGDDGLPLYGYDYKGATP